MLRSLLDQEPCGRTGNGSLTHLSKENSGTMCDGKILFTVAEDEKLVKIIPKYPCIYDVSVAQYKDQSLKDNAWKEIAEIIGRPVDDCKKRWRNIKDTYKKRQKKGIGHSGSRKKWSLADLLTFLNKGKNTSSIQSGENHNQKEASQFPLTSSTNDTQSQNVKDNPNSSLQTTRVNRETSQFPPTLSTKDTQSSNVEDISISLGQSSQDSRDTSQSHPTSSTTFQSQGMEDIRTFRHPSKRLRLEKNILESDSCGIERETMLKLIAEEKSDDDIDLFFKSIACSVKKLRLDLINEAKKKSLQMVIDLENRNSSEFTFPQEASRSPSTYSHVTSSPSSMDITIKTECDDT